MGADGDGPSVELRRARTASSTLSHERTHAHTVEVVPTKLLRVTFATAAQRCASRGLEVCGSRGMQSKLSSGTSPAGTGGEAGVAAGKRFR